MGKNYIENSLKRFLKRKVKITLGFVVAFLITGTIGFGATEEPQDLSKLPDKIDTTYTGGNYFISEENGSVTITNTKGGTVFDSATVTLDNNQTLELTTSGYKEGLIKNTTIGKNGEKKGIVNLISNNKMLGQALLVGKDEEINISVDELNINGFYGIKQTDGTTKLSANTLNIESKNDAIRLENGDFNITDSKDITITSTNGSGLSQTNGNINISADNLNITGKGAGVSLIDGDFTVNSNNFTIKSENGFGFSQASNSNFATNISADNFTITSSSHGVNIENGKFNIIDSQVINITSENGSGIYQKNGNTSISADDLIITSFSNGIAVSEGTFEVTNTKNITITSNGEEQSDEEKQSNGIYQSGGEINISTDSLNVLSSSSHGIFISEGTFNLNNSKEVNIVSTNGYGFYTKGTVEICTDNLEIIGSSGGIHVYTGELNLNVKEKITIANGTIDENGTGNAIFLEENTDFSLNKDLDNSDDIIVEIIGDIHTSSKNGFNLTLTNKDSFIDGKITTGSGEKATSNIGLSNGATWNNTGDSNVTNITLNGGVITNSSTENDITIDSLGGNGGTLNIGAGVDKDGNITSGKIEIGEITDKNSHFDIHYTGDANLEVDENSAEDIFENLAGNIIVNGDNKLNADATLEEGFVSDSYTSDLTIGKDGAVDVDNIQKIGTNSMVEGISDLATINLLTWRQEMNSLYKRMGELRNSTGEHGVWTRVYTGKIENGERYDNDYQTYQVGYDKKYSVDNGVMFVGGLVSYSKGETNYELGTGENYSVGAGIYATWLNNDGYFADVVLKQSRLHNKFDVSNKTFTKSQSGDYNNWGTSLSGQYGKRFDVNDKLFIEPSAELTLGRVEDTTYTTSAGVNVHQDTMYFLVGNVGTAVGYKINDKGNIYTRVSLVREFQGDIDTYYEHNSATNETHEDLSDTWVEFGIGANYRFAEDLNVYVDLQKTGEATVDTEWQANLGFRYEF